MLKFPKNSPSQLASVATAMSGSLAGMLNGGFSAALQEAFRPLLEEAFRRGLRVGVEMAKTAASSSIDAILTVDMGDSRQTVLFVEAKTAAQPAHRESATRARPGAVRPLVELALQERPGSRVIDIQNVAKMLDATISPSSVSNELNRHLGTRYRRQNARWFLIDGSEQDPGLAPETVPGSSVGGGEVGTPTPSPPASRAA